MLMWLGAALTGATALKARRRRQRVDLHSLAQLTRLVKGLIISRAGDFARSRPPKRFGAAYRGRAIATPGLLRALIGSHLRHALKRKDVFKQICALIAALRHLDAHAVRFAKRLRNRLTRLAPIFTAPSAAAPLVMLAQAQVTAIDTS